MSEAKVRWWNRLAAWIHGTWLIQGIFNLAIPAWAEEAEKEYLDMIAPTPPQGTDR